MAANPDPPQFSLTPATAVGGIIDYSTSAGLKLYTTATAKLEEDLFDCSANDLYFFLKALKDRAREHPRSTARPHKLSINH